MTTEKRSYVTYEKRPRLEGRKTDVWDVVSLRGAHLGEIYWYPQWRRYAFFPLPDTLFDVDCLEDIACFVETQMDERARCENAR